jgi:WhiB family redox-sensing transcriptional regulator
MNLTPEDMYALGQQITKGSEPLGYIEPGNKDRARERKRDSRRRARHAGEPVMITESITRKPVFLPVAVEPTRGSWRRRAACKNEDPEIFDGETAEAAAQAAMVCAVCPVRAACLEYAVANRTDYGVWAGVNFGVTYEQVPA